MDTYYDWKTVVENLCKTRKKWEDVEDYWVGGGGCSEVRELFLGGCAGNYPL